MAKGNEKSGGGGGSSGGSSAKGSGSSSGKSGTANVQLANIPRLNYSTTDKSPARGRGREAYTRQNIRDQKANQEATGKNGQQPGQYGTDPALAGGSQEQEQQSSQFSEEANGKGSEQKQNGGQDRNFLAEAMEETVGKPGSEKPVKQSGEQPKNTAAQGKQAEEDADMDAGWAALEAKQNEKDQHAENYRSYLNEADRLTVEKTNSEGLTMEELNEYDRQIKEAKDRAEEERKAAGIKSTKDKWDELRSAPALSDDEQEAWAFLGLNEDVENQVGGWGRQFAAGPAMTLGTALEWFDKTSDDMVRYEYDQEHGEGAYDAAIAGKNVNQIGQLGDKLWDTGVGLQESGQQMWEAGTADMSDLGREIANIAKTGTDVVGDIALNSVLPGLGTMRMYMGAAGNSAYEQSQRENSDVDSRMVAAVKGGLSAYLSNKLVGGLDAAYGESILGKQIHGMLGKTSPEVQQVLKPLLNTEGIEEGLEDILNYAADQILGLDSGKPLDWNEVKQDAFVGYVLGVLTNGLAGGMNIDNKMRQNIAKGGIEFADFAEQGGTIEEAAEIGRQNTRDQVVLKAAPEAETGSEVRRVEQAPEGQPSSTITVPLTETAPTASEPAANAETPAPAAQPQTQAQADVIDILMHPTGDGGKLSNSQVRAIMENPDIYQAFLKTVRFEESDIDRSSASSLRNSIKDAAEKYKAVEDAKQDVINILMNPDGNNGRLSKSKAREISRNPILSRAFQEVTGYPPRRQVNSDNIIEHAAKWYADQQTSTAVNTDPAAHTPEEQKIIDEYQAATDDRIRQDIEYARDIEDEDFRSKYSITLSKTVGSRVVNLIKRATGLDVSNFKSIIKGNSIKHIDKRHGVNGEADNSMADINDFARINYVIENADGATLVARNDVDEGTWVLSEEYRNADNSKAPLVLFYKKVNGVYYVAIATPDSKANRLAVVSAYINKSVDVPQELHAVPNDKTLSSTSETNLAPTSTDASDSTADAAKIGAQNPVNPNLAQDQNSVNTDSGEDAGAIGQPTDQTAGTGASQDSASDTTAETNANGVIYAGMDENDRYNHLKDKRIKLATADADAVPEASDGSLRTNNLGAIKRTILNIADRLGLRNVNFTNSSLNFPFELTGKGLKKSSQLQPSYSGTQEDYAKALSCIDDIITNAELIEVHPDYKVGSEKENADLKNTYVLLSAFRDGNGIIPVELEVKEYYTNKAGLYVVVTMKKIDSEVIKTSSDAKTGSDVPLLLSEDTISLQDLIANVNTTDADFLKYVPDGFLNAEQKAAKDKALAKRAAKYGSSNPNDSDQQTPPGDEGTGNSNASGNANTQEGNDTTGGNPNQNSSSEESNSEQNKKSNRAEHPRGTANPNDETDAEFDRLNKQHGSIEKGENPARDINVPKKDSKGLKVGEGARTVFEADATPEERIASLKAAVVNGNFGHVPVSNDTRSQNAASKLAKDGWTKSVADFMAAVDNGRADADTIALGAHLLNEAGNSTECSGKQYIDLAMAYNDAVSDAGSRLAAGRILKTLTPEGKLYGMEKTVEKMNRDIRKANEKRKPGRQKTEIKLDEGLVEDYLNAKTDEERNAAHDALIKDAAAQVPNTLRDKFTALRYLNMLGNFKTQVRNVAGNIGMSLVQKTKNEVVSAVEGVASAVTGGKYERQYKGLYAPSLHRAAVQDFNSDKNLQKAAMGEAKFSDVGKQAQSEIENAKDPFNNRNPFGWVLNKYSKATSAAMEVGDQIFVRTTYADALAGYLNAHKITADGWRAMVADPAKAAEVDKARAYAIKQAQEATFRDTNPLSKFVSTFDNRWGRLPKAIAQGVIPFRKTPANVLVRMEEYSPLGIVNTGVKAVQAAKGNADASEVIDSFAKTLTGTGIAALGYMLKQMGRVRTKEDDKNKDRLDKLEGKQDYSVEFDMPEELGGGRRSFTLDWLTPAAGSFFMGAELHDIVENGGITPSEAMAVLTSFTNPMLEMSMLSGVNDALNNLSDFNGDQSAVLQFALNSAWSYLTQGFTNTLLGQGEQFMEENRQSYYTDKDNPYLTPSLQKKIAKLGNKTPGFDYNSADYIDAWGRRQESDPNLLTRGANVFLNPGYVSKMDDKSTPVDGILEDLYKFGQEQTEQDTFPKVIPQTPSRSTTVNGKELTPKEYDVYATAAGRNKLKLVTELTKSKQFKSMDQFAQAETISELYQYADFLAASRIAQNRGEEYYDSKYSGIKNLDNPVGYIAAKNSFSVATKGETYDYDAIDALIPNIARMSSTDRDYLRSKNSQVMSYYDYMTPNAHGYNVDSSEDVFNLKEMEKENATERGVKSASGIDTMKAIEDGYRQNKFSDDDVNALMTKQASDGDYDLSKGRVAIYLAAIASGKTVDEAFRIVDSADRDSNGKIDEKYLHIEAQHEGTKALKRAGVNAAGKRAFDEIMYPNGRSRWDKW